jgi:hypothetical protein
LAGAAGTKLINEFTEFTDIGYREGLVQNLLNNLRPQSRRETG